MSMTECICKKWFEYYDANTNCIAIFGDWHVNEDHDIVNVSNKCNHYFIGSNNPMFKTREQILDQLSSKTWFDYSQRVTLLGALDFIDLE